MTALNAIRYDDAVAILTDGASYDADGIVRRLGPKCETIAGLNIALAVSGATAGRNALVRVLPRDFRDIDHIAEEGEAWFSDWYAVYADFLEEMAGRDILVVMGGWSPVQRRARMVLFNSKSADRPFGEAGAVKMPLMGEGMINGQNFHPLRDGVVLLERQRRYKGHAETDATRASENLVVGGHVMLTLVEKRGISHRILHTWPEDRVGEPIRPLPQIGQAASAAPMNRAARRRLARAA